MEPSAPEQIAPVVGKDTTIVLIQNGVGIEEPFQQHFPNNTVLSGVVSLPKLRGQQPYAQRMSQTADMGQ